MCDMDRSVIIIDPGRDARERRNSMLSAFDGLAELYILSKIEGKYEVKTKSELGVWEEVNETPSFDLCLIHGGDIDKRDRVDADYRIWYSGKRGYDSRVGDVEAIQDEDQIWRAIGASGGGALSGDEATELLEYVEEVRDSGQAEAPDILLPPASVSHLSALSILCQGYLAVHVEGYNEQEERWEPEEISPALEQMGWSEDLTTIASDKRSDEVSDPGWWQVFDGKDDLIDQAEDECGDEEALPDVLEDLLTRIKEGRQLGDKDARETVADAHCKLVERLGGRPCQ